MEVVALLAGGGGAGVMLWCGVRCILCTILRTLLCTQTRLHIEELKTKEAKALADENYELGR